MCRAQTWTDLSPETSDLHALQHNGASGGRVNGLAVGRDGSAYAATEWGGLYKSVDGGRQWTFLETHLPLATWRVAVDPSTPSRVYATSFFDGRVKSLAGINVSTDGGATWNHPASQTAVVPGCAAVFSKEPSAFGIAIDADHPSQVYVGTNCGLLASRDAGVSWTYVFPRDSLDAGRVWSVTVHDHGIIDLCGDGGHRRSTDGGATWLVPQTPLPSGQCWLASSPTEANTLFAYSGQHLYESIDGGANWSPAYSAPDSDGRLALLTTNALTHGFDLWFGSANLYRARCAAVEATSAQPCVENFRGPSGTPTANYGYDIGAHLDAGDLVFDPAASVARCPFLYANDGGIERNDRLGTPGCEIPRWSAVQHPPHALWVRSMTAFSWPEPWFDGWSEDVYLGTQDNGLFVNLNTDAVTRTWQNVDPADVLDVATDGLVVMSTVCCDPATYAKELIVRPRGAPGRSLITAPPFNLFDGDGVIAPLADGSWAALATTGLFVAPGFNGGNMTWNNLGLPAFSSAPRLGRLFASRGAAGNIVVYAQFTWTDGSHPKRETEVWRRVLGKAAWEQVLPPGGLGGFGAFAVSPSDPARLLAAHLNRGKDPQMVMSADGGTSWSGAPQLDACMTRRGQFEYRTAHGPTSGRADNGFEGYDQPSVLAFDPWNSSRVIAGAIDAGIFVSGDGGTHWSAVSDPSSPSGGATLNLSHARAAWFRVSTAGDTTKTQVYVATQGRGVWRFDWTNALVAALPAC
ncbi:MAG TPA: sialidase family protein [Gemmatimonadaceae bacterium]|nr:sialidase family protein [Gemmatimonadaceae bacterium]